MYAIQWDETTGGLLLGGNASEGLQNEVRPVFFEELDHLGFNEYWNYRHTPQPLLWAVGGRNYYYRGKLVAVVEGGGLFSSPKLQVRCEGLELDPVDVETMLAKNEVLLQGLVQKSLKFICQTMSRHENAVDMTAVAFSGGKDSLVTLDLVQRALDPNQFLVVFGDTGMEITDTYQAVEEAKARWPNLEFRTAKSSQDAKSTWRQLGPPSRIHRWCCAVHKSVPTLLLLRDLVGKPAVKALIFDGIRHEESASRSNYLAITEGGKHKAQINASPIISWNSAEVFLYLLGRDLLLNKAYRHGATRVGCAICPMASSWWDMIGWKVYKQDLTPFVEELRKYAIEAGVSASEVDRYLEQGNWKRRSGGRFLPNGGNRVVEQKDGSRVSFILRQPSEQWEEWAKTIGKVVRMNDNSGVIQRDDSEFRYLIRHQEKSMVVEVSSLSGADRFTLSAFRAAALKSTYCCHCRACEVECPTGALGTLGRVTIGETCVACGACLNVHGKSCLAAKSLATSEGGTSVSANGASILHTYDHFGMEKDWLSQFFASPEEWASKNTLGNRQFDAMVAWLKHAELISGGKKALTVTELGARLARLGPENPITWAVIWTNLARNSTPVDWYVSHVRWGESFSKAELVDKIGETHSQSESTRKNAITALVGLLTKTPLGNELGLCETIAVGAGRNGLYKKGWDDPHPIGVLYSLYRYAELTGRYELTVSELYQEASEGPFALFGIRRDVLEGILKGLSVRADGAIRTSIVRDLDNVFLDGSRKAIQVLDLVER